MLQKKSYNDNSDHLQSKYSHLTDLRIDQSELTIL